MSNEKKMTKVQAFTIALEAVKASNVAHKTEVMEKLEKELEQLAKKNSATSGKPTAKQIANMGLGEMVVAFMAENPNQLFTVSELLKAVPGLPEETTAPKMTAILRMDSVKAHVDNTKVKGKSLYQYKSEVAEGEGE